MTRAVAAGNRLPADIVDRWWNCSSFFNACGVLWFPWVGSCCVGRVLCASFYHEAREVEKLVAMVLCLACLLL